MTTGTAIFFGAVMVAIAILYSTTKDRWNWKKIIKRAGFIPLGLVVLWALLALYFTISSKIENRPKKQTELKDVKLGSSKQDIIFLKGKPNLTTEDLVKEFERRKLPISDKEKIRDFISYENLDITFEQDKATFITSTCKRDYDYSSVNGIECGDNISNIEKKLGKTNLVECSKDFLTRIYSFPKYQTAYILTQNSVTGFVVYNDESESKRITNRDDFDKCDPKKE